MRRRRAATPALARTAKRRRWICRGPGPAGKNSRARLGGPADCDRRRRGSPVRQQSVSDERFRNQIGQTALAKQRRRRTWRDPRVDAHADASARAGKSRVRPPADARGSATGRARQGKRPRAVAHAERCDRRFRSGMEWRPAGGRRGGHVGPDWEFNFTAFDLQTGARAAEQRLAVLHNSWFESRVCQFSAVQENYLMLAGGTVVCCDPLGKVRGSAGRNGSRRK